MNRQLNFSRITHRFHFQFRLTRVIMRLASFTISVTLLTWRLIDLADEFLKGEIHMSTSAGILTGMAAFLLQALIIVGLALVIFWIMRRPQIQPDTVRQE